MSFPPLPSSPSYVFHSTASVQYHLPDFLKKSTRTVSALSL